jgi:hypothetical protein
MIFLVSNVYNNKGNYIFILITEKELGAATNATFFPFNAIVDSIGTTALG